MADTIQIRGAGHYENQFNPQIGEMESTWVQDETPVHTDYSSTYDGATTASMLSKTGIDLSKLGYSPDQIGSIPGLVAHLNYLGANPDSNPNSDVFEELSAVMKNPALFVQQQMEQAVSDYGFGTNAQAGDAYVNDKKTQMQDLAKWLGSTGQLSEDQISQAASQAYKTGYTRYRLPENGMETAFKIFAPMILAPFTAGLSSYLGTALGSAAAGSAIVGGLTSALTGGDILQGAVMGGLGSVGNVGIGNTGFTIGDALKGIKAADAISKGNVLGAFSSISSMSGVGNTKIGDTGFTINDLAKNANLLNAVIKGNPVALMNTIAAISKSSSNSPAASSNAPLDAQALSELTPEERAAYDLGGMSGLKTYAAQQKTEDTTPTDGNLATVAVTAPPPPPAPPVDLSALTPSAATTPAPAAPPLATVAINSTKDKPPITDLSALDTVNPPPVKVPVDTNVNSPLNTLTVVSTKDKPPITDLSALDTVNTPPVRVPVDANVNSPLATVTVNSTKDKPPVVDLSALDTVNPTVTTPVAPVIPKSSTGPVVPEQEIVITGKKDPIDLSTINDAVVTPTAPLTVTPVKPEVTTPVKTSTPPVAPSTTPKSTTTTRSPTTASGFFDPVLDTSPQFLAGKYVPTKELSKLASLHQLFNSLHPDMQEVMSERNSAPPPLAMEDIAQNQSSKLTPEEQIKANQTVFSASGGLISSETQKIIDSLSPKFASPASTFLAGAPVTQHQSPLGTLKNLAQGPLKGPKLGSGLSHGGLPHKYAEAAPRGHNPEFITGLTGYYAQGGGTGQSDDIPAMLHDGDFVMDADTVASLGDGSSKAGAEVLEQMRNKVPYRDHQGGHPVPAQIADGEYVFPAAFVTAIGGGSNKVGAERLNEMREKIRAHKRSAPTSKIPPKAKSPLDYLKMAKG